MKVIVNKESVVDSIRLLVVLYLREYLCVKFYKVCYR